MMKNAASPRTVAKTAPSWLHRDDTWRGRPNVGDDGGDIVARKL
jgi:hypothetical protein